MASGDSPQYFEIKEMRKCPSCGFIFDEKTTKPIPLVNVGVKVEFPLSKNKICSECSERALWPRG